MTAQAIEAATAGETTEIGSTEGESAVASGDAPESSRVSHTSADTRRGMVSDFWLEQSKLAENMAIPMILFCPLCSTRHIDEAEFAEVAHHTHACQGCGFVWRPAKVNTHGVRFLPGYSNVPPPPQGAS